jgi:hypothetical protein
MATIGDYGPLAALTGEWEGAEGLDVAPSPMVLKRAPIPAKEMSPQFLAGIGTDFLPILRSNENSEIPLSASWSKA